MTIKPPLLFPPFLVALLPLVAAAAPKKPRPLKAPPAKAAPRATPVAKPAAGNPDGEFTLHHDEIRMDGSIYEIDLAAKTLVLRATSFRTPASKSVEFAEAKEKTVLLDQKPALYLRGDANRTVTWAELKVGTSVIVVGRDDPATKQLLARRVAVWDQMVDGKYRLVPPPDVKPGSAPPLKAPPVPVGLEGLKLPPPPPPDRPLLVPQLGHSITVTFVAYFPDGKTLITFAPDLLFKYWDVRTGKLLKTVVPPASPSIQNFSPYEIALSPNGKLLAYCSLAGEIILCDARTCRVVQEFKVPLQPYGVAFSPDGKHLATGSIADTVRVWEVDSGEYKTYKEQTDGIRALAYSSDGKWLATGGTDHRIRVWDTKTGTLIRTVEGHSSAVRTLAFSPDGTLLVSGSLEPPHEDFRVRVSDARTGNHRYELHQQGAIDLAAVVFTPDGKELLTVGQDTRRWDPVTGKSLGSLGLDDAGLCLAFSPDGKKLAASSYRASAARVYDLPTRRLERTLGSLDSIARICLSPDGSLLAALTAAGVVLWDVQPGRLQRRTVGRTIGNGNTCSDFQFSSDGKLLYIAYFGREVGVWEVATGRILKTFRHNRSLELLALSADGSRLVASSRDYRGVEVPNGQLTVMDPVSGAILKTIDLVGNLVWSMALSPHGDWLLGSLDDGRVLVWDLSTGKIVHTLGKFPITPSVLTRENRNYVAVSPDGKLAGVGAMDGLARIYDVASGSVKFILQTKIGADVYFTPDSKWVVTLTGEDAVVAWDLETGRPHHSFSGHSHTITFSKNTGIMAYALGRIISLWNLASGGALLRLIAVPPTNNSGGTDWMAITPEGYYDCSPGSDRVIQWRLQDRFVPFTSFEETHRNRKVIDQALRGQPSTLPPLTLARNPPECRVVSPPPDTVVSGASATLEVEATDDRSIQRFRYYVNGVPVPEKEIRTEPAQVTPLTSEAPGAALGHKTATRVRVTLPLPPGDQELRIRVEAMDDEKNRDDTVVTLLRPEEPPVRGNLYVVCVGVNRYREAGHALKLATEDAEALAAVLRKQQGRQYERVLATVLVDEKATVPAIRAALKQLQASRPQDTVLLLFAGHGWKEGEGYYFLPHEANFQQVAATGLSWTEVVMTLAAVRGRKLLLADACRSGGQLGPHQASGEELARAAEGTGIVMFASSSGDQNSEEQAELGHGVFTYALLEALAGKGLAADQPAVTLQEVLRYVPERVMTLTEERQTPRVPYLEDFNLDAVLTQREPASTPGKPEERKK